MKKHFKAVSLFLALAMLLSTVIVAVVADPVYNAAGYRDDLVIRVPLDDVPDIQAFWSVSSEAYCIKDAQGLLFLSSEVQNGNSFAGKTVYLANDILVEQEVAPIGVRTFALNASGKIELKENLAFEGIFDGQGHAIKNLKMDLDASECVSLGLFGNLKGSVKNLILDESCSFTWTNYDRSAYVDYGSAAAIAAYAEQAVFYNVSSSASVVSVGHAAALAGRGSVATVENCTNRGAITGNHTGGGLLGFDTGGHVLNSENYGTVSADKASGLVGRSRRTQRIESSVNYGTVNGRTYAAGIASLEQKASVSLSACINYGTVWASDGKNTSPLLYRLGTEASGKMDARCEDRSGAVSLPTVEPNADTVGYSSLRVEKVELSGVTDLESLSQNVYFLNEAAYKITSPAGLYRFDALVSSGVSFRNVTVYLANDINLSGVSMSPIGWSGQISTAVNQAPVTAFDGTFDGQGNMICNLTMVRDQSHMRNCNDTTNYSGVSFFGILKGAVVKNLIIDSTCSFTYTADPHDHGCAAGFAFAAHDTQFQNCMNLADVRSSSRFSGGIVGRAHGNVIVENCTNAGDVIGCQSAGGMIAYGATSNLTLRNCRNMGSIIVNRGYAKSNRSLVGSDHGAGGILGWIRSKTVTENCVNNGTVMGIDCVGGIVGKVGDGLNHSFQARFSNNRNYGIVTSSVHYDNYFPILATEGSIAGLVIISEENYTEEGSVDVRGAQDASCGVEALTPDYSVEKPPVTGATEPPITPPTPPDDGIVGYSESRIVKKNVNALTDLADVSQNATYLGEKEYKITSVSGFDRLDTLIGNGVDFSGITVYLANDVDFADEEFSPIGWSGQLNTSVNQAPQNAFNGTFDGQGHMVANVFAIAYDSHKLNNTDTVNYSGVSFFGILRDATVKNLIIHSSCTFLYLADSDDHGCAAGIAFAAHNSSFENCMNMSNVGNSSRFSGGIVGRAHGTVTVSNCTNTGMIGACQNAAGIVAYSASALHIVNCRNVGDVECFKGYGDVGEKLVGSDHSAAGMVGWIRENSTVTGCINNGTVTGIDNVAGIAGQVGNACGSDITVILTDNINYGLVLMSEDSKTETNTGAPNTPIIAMKGSVWAENNVKDQKDCHPICDPYRIRSRR